jgi:hypothetical protein
MTKGNPYHKPAGTPEGGQFTSGNATMNKLIREGAGIGLKYEDVKSKGSYGKNYIITGDDKLYDTSSQDTHAEFIGSFENPEEFGLTKKRAEKFLKAYQAADESKKALMMNAWSSIFESGAIRITEDNHGVSIETNNVDDSTLKRLQRLVDEDKIGLPSKAKIVWSSHSTEEYADNLSYADFMSAKHVVYSHGRYELR